MLAPALRALRVEMTVQARHYMCVVSATDSILARIDRVRTMFFCVVARPTHYVSVSCAYILAYLLEEGGKPQSSESKSRGKKECATL